MFHLCTRRSRRSSGFRSKEHLGHIHHEYRRSHSRSTPLRRHKRQESRLQELLWRLSCRSPFRIVLLWDYTCSVQGSCYRKFLLQSSKYKSQHTRIIRKQGSLFYAFSKKKKKKKKKKISLFSAFSKKKKLLLLQDRQLTLPLFCSRGGNTLFPIFLTHSLSNSC